MDEKILGGEPSLPLKDKGVLPGQEIETSELQAEPVADFDTAITEATRKGGLDEAPKSYEDDENYWKSIHSANPFEVLYLDYRLYKQITPEIVKKNYDALQKFWLNKNDLMVRGAREKIKKRFGEDTVVEAPKKLDAAYNKLKTAEGIELYYKEVDVKRYRHGLEAIKEYIEFTLLNGELTKQAANKIIAKGLEYKLTDKEIRDHLQEKLVEKGFKPRATKPHPDIFDNHWMTDERWKIAQTRTATIFGITISSLEELGEVLFNNKEKAVNYLKNANYLPMDVTKLDNSDKAMEFEEMINSEKNLDWRYLRVMYRLNPSLPFRIDDLLFENIHELFDKTANDYFLYEKAADNFIRGFLHLWLYESDPVIKSFLPPDLSTTSFLRFLFKVKKDHPFFLNGERFPAPIQLIEKAKTERVWWYRISEVITNGQLPAWFEGIGKGQWIEKYNTATEAIIRSDYHSDEDKKMAAVQIMMAIVDPSITVPEITTVPTNVKLLSLPGSGTTEQPVNIKLKTPGFIKAKVYLDRNIDGIRLSENLVTLHSQAGTPDRNVSIFIESLKLLKDKLYSANIIIESEYEKITIPVDVKVVFPKMAYYGLLVKYAVVGALFFGGIRFLLGVLTGHESWLHFNYSFSGYLPFGMPKEYLPSNYFLFFIALLVFIIGLILSLKIIKKVEKI